MLTLSLDHRLDHQNLTDISAGVKHVIQVRPTGASRAPPLTSEESWRARHYAAIEVTFWPQVPLTYMLPSASSTSSGLNVVGISRYLQAAMT